MDRNGLGGHRLPQVWLGASGVPGVGGFKKPLPMASVPALRALWGTEKPCRGQGSGCKDGCSPLPSPPLAVGDGSPWGPGLRCRCLDRPLSGAPGAAGGMKTGGWGSPTPRRGGLSPGRTARTGRAQGSGRGSTGHCPPGRAPPMAPPIAIAPPTAPPIEPLISQPIAPPRPSPRQSLRPSLRQSLRPAHRSANRPAPVAPPPAPLLHQRRGPAPPTHPDEADPMPAGGAAAVTEDAPR